ncbi:hypothetical protein FQA47_004611 [Oryzias melastigma]|uniref:Uncharacterized protein n=1 Tax=Oryzias melastigma TaxID=30732 RepID=A0A834FM92_ORYME|nr:hypothetical protein FQA47_004611 [Oryzias melastigma]
MSPPDHWTGPSLIRTVEFAAGRNHGDELMDTCRFQDRQLLLVPVHSHAGAREQGARVRVHVNRVHVCVLVQLIQQLVASCGRRVELQAPDCQPLTAGLPLPSWIWTQNSEPKCRVRLVVWTRDDILTVNGDNVESETVSSCRCSTVDRTLLHSLLSVTSREPQRGGANGGEPKRMRTNRGIQREEVQRAP